MMLRGCSISHRFPSGHLKPARLRIPITRQLASSVEKTPLQPPHIVRNDLQLRTSQILSGVQQYKNAPTQLIKTKWTDAYNFYESFSHMDEVREAYDKVITIQSQLLNAQKRRVNLMNELTAVRKEQQMIQDELSNCSRSADRYLGLVRLEIDARKAEQAKILEFQNEDQNERNLFTHLTAAVTASHEKEKIYAHTVKYWSILLSILGAAVGVAGTTLSYYYRANALKDLSNGYATQISTLHEQIGCMQKEFAELAGEIRLARMKRIDFEENLIQSPVQTTESWISWQPFKVVFGVFSSNVAINEAERSQRMKDVGGDGSWRL